MIGQFSSIGSMGLDKTKWLAGEFQRTMTTVGKSSLRSDPPLHLVRSLRSMHVINDASLKIQPSQAEKQLDTFDSLLGPYMTKLSFIITSVSLFSLAVVCCSCIHQLRM